MTLTVERCELSRVLPILVQVMRPRSDTSGGMESLQDVCQGGQAFAVVHEGRDVGAYSLLPLVCDRGVTVWIQAGAGRLDGVDLTATIIKTIEAQAAGIGAKAVGMVTARPGLVRKLYGQGWRIAGTKMVKKVGA